jgi:predicted RNA binding protein YcfA (HicA-like mRNA interferase family)
LAKLPQLSGKDLGKIVEKLGFVYSHTKGSHMIFKHPDGRKTTIPHHSGEKIGPGLLNKILRKELLIKMSKMVYTKRYLDYLKENDSIESWEEGFMNGYLSDDEN